MNILLVTTYFEPDSGAAAVRLSRLARILQARGHVITVLTTLPHYPQGRIHTAYRGKLVKVENRDGLRVIRTWLWATPSPKISRKLISQNTFMWSALLRGLGIARPDVVLIEAQPVFTSLAGVILSRLKGAPYVLNVSDLWPDHLLSVGTLTETHPVYRAARRLVDSTYRGAAKIVAMSPAWAQKIRGTIGQDDTTQVIYNGVDLQRFRPGLDVRAFRQEHQLGEAKIVSFIGTFATQYDFEAMLRAVEHFRGRPDVIFLFIGGGSQSEILQQRMAAGDLPNCRWITWLEHERIPEAWAVSRVAFWAMGEAALYQGTIPAKLYEALASGTPVAAAMSGEGTAMLEQAQAGLTVSPGDVTGLIAALTRLLDDDALHNQCAQSGRAYAEAHFDPQKVASAYEAVLLAATASAGG